MSTLYLEMFPWTSEVLCAHHLNTADSFGFFVESPVTHHVSMWESERAASDFMPFDSGLPLVMINRTRAVLHGSEALFCRVFSES
jgi:hypothetical protein